MSTEHPPADLARLRWLSWLLDDLGATEAARAVRRLERLRSAPPATPPPRGYRRARAGNAATHSQWAAERLAPGVQRAPLVFDVEFQIQASDAA